MSDAAAISTEPEKPLKIGGWLYLISLGVFIGPIVMIVTTLVPVVRLFFSESWTLLTSQASSQYLPGFAQYAVWELITDVVILALNLCAAWAFLKKARQFPRIYKTCLLFSLGVVFMDALLFKQVLGDRITEGPGMEIPRALFAALIWVPYLSRSVRVHRTFVVEGVAPFPKIWVPKVINAVLIVLLLCGLLVLI